MREPVSKTFPALPERQVGSLVRTKLALPYRQYVALVQRASFGEPQPVQHHMSDVTADLLQSDQPALIVTGHFDREAMLAVFERGALPRTLAGVAAPKAAKPPFYAAAKWEMFQTIADSVEIRNGGETIRRTPGGTFESLVDRLREPRGTVHIHADAVVDGSPSHTFTRPFAGTADRVFATGTARLARVAQAPMLLYFARRLEDGSIDISWSDPVQPARLDDEEGDVRVMSTLLDEIERQIGRHPETYVLPIGSDRQWDPHADKWVDRT
jgi:lauroyl/myristoyl acyltransferase